MTRREWRIYFPGYEHRGPWARVRRGLWRIACVIALGTLAGLALRFARG